MQQETRRLDDDDVYELDRKAWNLPLPRPRLTIAPSLPDPAADDRSGHGSHSNGESEPGA